MKDVFRTATAEPDATAPVSVLCVDRDVDYLALVKTVLDGTDSVSVAVETNPTAALDAVDGVDCVVSDVRTAGVDATDLLDRVRERRPGIPFVVHTSAPLDEVDGSLLARPATDYLRKEWGTARVELLHRRVRFLVDHQRTERTLERVRTGLEMGREATLVADPDGTVGYVNRRLASELSRERDEVLGRPWTELFTEGAAGRLRTSALPAADDGWNWSGECVLRTGTGAEVPARTSLARLEDGSVVFVFHELDRRRDSSA